MHRISHNTVFKKSILGFLVVTMLLAPITASVNALRLEIPTVNALENAPPINFTNPAPGSAATVDPTAQTNGFFSGITDKINPFSTIGNALSSVVDGAINLIGNLILVVASSVTHVAGALLDASLEFTVFEMGEKLNGGEFGGKIDTMWKLIRDICNLVFIFGFIFTGIRTIIDPENAETKRFVSRIIIGALLINFSLFFVKIIIDFSNFTALQIYNAFISDATWGTMTGKIMDLLGMTSIFKSPDVDFLAKLTDPTSIWFYILGAVFLFIAGFTFLAAAILLVIRFVALVFIMVASPILFAGTIFPQTEEYASDLWKKLIHYAFFAPAYLLMTLISITLLQGLNLRTAGSSFSGALSGHSEMFPVILNFCIVIFFMIGALMTAQKMGIAGGEMAVKVGKNLKDRAQNNVLRYASQQMRHFDQTERHIEQHKDPSARTKNWAGKAGASWIGHQLKRTPLLEVIQLAGEKAEHDVKHRASELKGMRNAELKARLETFVQKGPLSGLGDFERLAIYTAFKDKGDIDELDPEEVRDYLALTKKFKMGSTSIRRVRADAFELGTIGEEGVMRMKEAKDINNLHIATVRISDEKDSGGREVGATEAERTAKRQAHVNEFVDELINRSNGAMVGALGRRNDEITEAFMKRLHIRMSAAGITDLESAESYSEFFEKMAEEAGERGDRAVQERNISAANFFRNGVSARAFIRAEKKPEGGTRSTTTTQNLNPENPQAQKVLDDEQAARDQAATDAREQAEAQQAQAEAAQAQAQAQAAAAASSNGDAEGGGGGGHGH